MLVQVRDLLSLSVWVLILHPHILLPHNRVDRVDRVADVDVRRVKE
jgi:hypothetical protein